MEIIWSVVIGGLVGSLFVRRAVAPEITIITPVLGIIGSVLAATLGSALNLFTERNGAAVAAASFVGAMGLLLGYRALYRLVTDDDE